MLRGTTKGITVKTVETSSRLMDGTSSRTTEGVRIAVPAPEQIGQACESIAVEFKSTQQCISVLNRAHANTTARKQMSFERLVISSRFWPASYYIPGAFRRRIPSKTTPFNPYR